MSIAMDRFASQGLFPTLSPVYVAEPRVSMFYVQCRSCGFEPDVHGSTPKTCPKCGSTGWERFNRPGSLLANADRF